MKSNPILDKHKNDKDQLDFILSTATNIVVTAPAGCGKTTAMISKIAWELEQDHIGVNKKILALTFSVNAAQKIEDSLKVLLPEIVNDTSKVLKKVQIANYHRFALQLLHKYGYSISKKLTELDKFKIIDDNHLNAYLNSEDETIMKNFANAINNSDTQKIRELYKSYWNILKDNLFSKNIITYNGILLGGIYLFANKNIESFYNSYYDLILIDEFQDTNKLQYYFVLPLIKNNRVVFLGDDTQKIYGFIGAENSAMRRIKDKFHATEFDFKINYRFKNNERIKQLDHLVRSYANDCYKSDIKAEALLKALTSECDEVSFIVNGLKSITQNSNSNVAVLVRTNWQGEGIVSALEENNIPFFNALFKESDQEFINFYKVATEEFHKITSKKATQRDLQQCQKSIKERKDEIIVNPKNAYVFTSLFHLLDKLFSLSISSGETAKERYLYIDSYLKSNSLKHMMEYIDEQIILTTIHSAKGLEWDYVIIPQIIAGIFPSYNHVCKKCEIQKTKSSSCKFDPKFNIIKDELKLFYVAITRAKKEVFLTTNTGSNRYGYRNKMSCLINLDGLSLKSFTWEEYFDKAT